MDEIDAEIKNNKADQEPEPKKKAENIKPENLGSSQLFTLEFTKYLNTNLAILEEVFYQVSEEAEEHEKRKRNDKIVLTEFRTH